MIKNELEYQTTQDWVKRFTEAITKADQDQAKKTSDPQGWQMTRDVLQVHLEGLLEEVAEYETLNSLEPQGAITLKASWLTELPQILIKARIAANLSQEELAAIIGITEEEIRSSEKNNYALTPFTTILDIAAALGVELESATFAVDFAEVNRWRQRLPIIGNRSRTA
ncbi:MAG: helix-turn-helix transcriptional regulator [Symploca sp. SIO2E6]|nr:helix-turn-helix transcriptional regulator [Symploca sp. SIO2E6]